MIVVMKRSATDQDIDSMIKHVESLGMKPVVLRGTERTVIAAIGEERVVGIGQLESGPGVDEVLPILAPYKLASRELKPEPTVVRAGSLTVGGGVIGVIAGPCSVESEKQIVDTARAVKSGGATALRGGAFKPRTSPYSFQGLKEAGLKMLAAARDETGLAVVTEVIAPDDVELVSEYADVLQIGARNMQNYRLLEAAGNSPRPSCSSAAPAPPSTNGCSPPSTSSTPATPTSCSASAASAPSKPTPDSRSPWPRRLMSKPKRTCPW